MFASRYVEDLQEQIKEVYGDIEKFTIGILVADADQREAREYILNYLNMFDRRSGKYIDFFLPGYYTDSMQEMNDVRKKYHPNSYVRERGLYDKYVYSLNRTGKAYYFDRDSFETFIGFMTNELGIQYTYNPMLIMLEIDTRKSRGELAYQKKLVIDLDEDSNRGLRRTGMLFDKIFEIAKSNVALSKFGSEVRAYYIKGAAINRLIRGLEGEYIEAVAEVVGDVLRFRVR